MSQVTQFQAISHPIHFTSEEKQILNDVSAQGELIFGDTKRMVRLDDGLHDHAERFVTYGGVLYKEINESKSIIYFLDSATRRLVTVITEKTVTFESFRAFV